MSHHYLGRRTFLASATAALTAASLQVSMSKSARAKEDANMDASHLGNLKSLRAGVLNVGYYDIGPADGRVVVLLHGFPYDVQSYIEVGPSLAKQNYRVLIPYLRGHGPTNFVDASTPRSGEQAALGKDLIDFLDALRIERAIFAGYDWGGRAGCVAAALWPERCSGLVSVNGYLIQDIANAGKPAPARVERGFWYQFYFQTDRGRAGLQANRGDIAKIMWRENSPTWKFDDVTFERSAKSFENPDYVDVVIHSYRHRLGGAPGYPQYEDLQSRLAAQPKITVPTVTLDGDADGVVLATDGKAQASRFSAKRVHHVIAGAGHNLPQEAPSAFVDAIKEVSAMA